VRSLWLAMAVLCLARASVAGGPPSGQGQALKIVPPHARLGPGESVRFKVVRTPETGFRWRVEGRGGIRDGLYRAPYVVSQPGERARIIATGGPKTTPELAEALVEMTAGAFPGAEDCLGAGQQWDATGMLGYFFMEELPEVITKVPPRYPPSAQARSLQGAPVVNALVCRSGQVIDATVQWGEGVTPIPELEELAIDAVRQWVFKPGTVQGQPVACMVAVPLRIPPP
jgi:TonB family protein